MAKKKSNQSNTVAIINEKPVLLPITSFKTKKRGRQQVVVTSDRIEINIYSKQVNKAGSTKDNDLQITISCQSKTVYSTFKLEDED